LQGQSRVERTPRDIYPGTNRLVQETRHKPGKRDGAQTHRSWWQQTQANPSHNDCSESPYKKVDRFCARDDKPKRKEADYTRKCNAYHVATKMPSRRSTEIGDRPGVPYHTKNHTR
jgi:hypothetical protein